MPARASCTGCARTHDPYDVDGGAKGARQSSSAWPCERLAAYWTEALGGRAGYTDSYGDETSVVRSHSGNGPHREMDLRAIECFDRALTDVNVLDDPLRSVLHDYWAWATTTTMARYEESPDEVPDDLFIPRWSWAGLQAAPS